MNNIFYYSYGKRGECWVYKITNNIYLEEYGYGIVNIDHLKSPFLKYTLKNGKPVLNERLYFVYPKADKIKVKELSKQSPMFIAVSKELNCLS
ncbi:hypothetical protein D920_00252 [Enterococcus faecalis 13-SD-W-01]|nr:hypothetical protein D920_00252 [Enterococcus faecalis 13-SD-W-01]